MKLTPVAYVRKWGDRFADNDNFIISARDLREFSVDTADTFGVTVANVPYYMAGTTYAVGTLVRYIPLGGQEAFYYALNSGQLTAPGPGNVTDWKVVPGPIEPTALSHSLTLSHAQGLDQAGVVAGREYLIDCGPDGNGNTQTVTVRGIANDFYDVEGTLEVAGVRTAITDFNVQAGTWKVQGAVDAYTKAQADALLATVATALPLRPEKTNIYDSLLASDIGGIVPVNNPTGTTLTIPAGLGLPAPASGTMGAARICYLLQTGPGLILIDAAQGVSVKCPPTQGYKSKGQYARLVLTWLDTDTVLVEGGVQ